MNKTIVQGKWRRVRGNLKTEWGRLTDNDRRQIDGKIDQMVGLVQERYGYTQERAAKVLTHYLGDYGKRSPKRVTTPAKKWGPAMSLIGLLSLTVMGWFFFSRFLTDAADIPAVEFNEAEYLDSPEEELV